MNRVNRIRHTFEVVNPNRFKEVKHFKLTECSSLEPFLKEWANISVDRKFNNSKGIKYQYKSKNEGSTWDKKPITGLFVTNYENIYFGDISTNKNGFRQKVHFLLFGFINNMNSLIIDVFPNYYPNDPNYFIK